MKAAETFCRWLPAMLFLGASALDCATTAGDSEPARARPQEIVGLAPLSEPASAPPVAPPTPIVPISSGGGNGATAAVSGDRGLPALSSPPAGDACAARAGARAVKRVALGRTLDAGLGTWLRGVDVEAKVDRGHFQGWLVRSIYAGDPCWSDVDLRAGDIVTRVNRRPVERPEEAQLVWTALRSSDEIVVEYVREGKARSVKFAVVDAPE